MPVRQVLIEARIVEANDSFSKTLGSRLGWGDNTNLIIGQVAQKRFGVDCTVVRILDPARADFYRERGLRTICPTSTAIDALSDAVRSCDIPQRPLEEAPV